MRVVSISVSDAGSELARRLPYERVHGSAAKNIKKLWSDVDAFVLMLATGAAVRIVGSLLKDKSRDPGIVCVDEAARFAIALCGGHAGGANDLALEVADLLGLQPVITTGTDSVDICSLDSLPGFVASGDIAGVSSAMLNGRVPFMSTTVANWPLPAVLDDKLSTRSKTPQGPEQIVVTDESLDLINGVVALHPPSLVVGVGCSSDADPSEAIALLNATMDRASLDLSSVAVIATVEQRANHRAITGLAAGLATGLASTSATGSAVSSEPTENQSLAPRDTPSKNQLQKSCAAKDIKPLGDRDVEPDHEQTRTSSPVGNRLLPIKSFSPDELMQVEVPNPSTVVSEAIGTHSVAEAAAILAAGVGGQLIVEKCKSERVTVAIARRNSPPGHIYLVGLGPGSVAHRTPAANTAIRNAEIVIGYGPYIDQASDLLSPAQIVIRSPIGNETLRAQLALDRASEGRTVAVVCSGDAGIYAMASIVIELTSGCSIDFDIEVIPGITAALASAALLGAPLGHDHAIISLSDLLTDWKTIETRLYAAAKADFAVALYNPRSLNRTWQIDKALDIFRLHRPPTTPVGIVIDAGRKTQRSTITNLETIDSTSITMTTCVIIGSSTTRIVSGKMITPRGYNP